MRPIEFVYSINGTALEKVDEIKDLGVIIVGPNFEHVACVCSPHQSVYSERLERVHSLCGASTAVESVAVASL
jgi:hypothetical protein